MAKWFLYLCGTVALVVWMVDFVWSTKEHRHPDPMVGGIAAMVFTWAFGAPTISAAAKKLAETKNGDRNH